jgi:hypothetical protein
MSSMAQKMKKEMKKKKLANWVFPGDPGIGYDLHGEPNLAFVVWLSFGDS